MQRHSIKAILKTDKKNEQGHYAVYIRITINKKPSYISTGYYVPKALFDRKEQRVKEAHPLHETINAAIVDKKRQLLQKLLQGNMKGEVFSAQGLKKQTAINVANGDFFSFFDMRVKRLTGKRKGTTIANWTKHLRKLEGFNKTRKLPFISITPEFLAEFEAYLKEDECSDNYIYTIFKTMKGVINDARRKGHIERSPFQQFEMPDYTPANKEHLTLEELDLWEQYYVRAKTKKQKAAIAYYLLGCCTGLRISDWYLFNRGTHLKDNYIRLRAKKNGEWVTIPIYKRLSRVLELTAGHTLTMDPNNLTTLLGAIAKKAGINKHISSHCARKTFAVTMCLDRGISSETAAELMGITLEVFVRSYSKVTPEKIRKETERAWEGL